MNDSISARVRAIVGRLAKVDREIGGDDRLIEDLGLSSMALVELSVALESEFDLQPVGGDEAPADLATVADLEKLIAAAQSSATPAI
ncbi:acyl carrier protein [Nocardia sp. alder85J]|uniref:acyl carrier protein n=1 Tax=Nocardia sp. alder85J TaxID=2862949 RepID=UPI001CD38809|nr:acyl carrier protein [Nocardia sp. alder85J]MCX4098517.1 acyl carrier protein [Nocardia sp. alder85J]